VPCRAALNFDVWETGLVLEGLKWAKDFQPTFFGEIVLHFGSDSCTGGR